MQDSWLEYCKLGLRPFRDGVLRVLVDTDDWITASTIAASARKAVWPVAVLRSVKEPAHYLDQSCAVFSEKHRAH